MDFIGLFLLFLLGCLMVLNPTLLWKIEGTFIAREGEPSHSYIALMRLVGSVFVVAAVVFALSIIL